ncbi:ABC transporter permease [bacterium]|nr:ABC transporter permease [bacterium]
MSKLSIKDQTLNISGKIVIANITVLLKDFDHKFGKEKISKLNLKDVEEIDGAGVSFIETILDRNKLTSESLENGNPTIMKTIEIFKTIKGESAVKPVPDNIFVKTGDNFLSFIKQIVDGLYLASDTIWWSITGIVNKKGRRKGSVTEQAIAIGLDALPIVALLSFVIGFILTLQSGFQLQKFGANVYIADLLSISIVREMGPLITAIIIAGRSGSAIASEIATMKVTEEIDALKMMALNPIKYVIVPKFHAITLTMPILVAFSILISMGAGLLISVGFLDVALEVYISRSINILAVKDIIITLIKTITFSWLIVIIGAYYGMKVTGGAEGVGKATTSSVVTSIFAVILADAAFSLIYL